MPPLPEVEILLFELLKKYPYRWSDEAIVFALANFDGNGSLEDFLDEAEWLLAELRIERWQIPPPPESGQRLKDK
jgi:hypothetical protein